MDSDPHAVHRKRKADDDDEGHQFIPDPSLPRVCKRPRLPPGPPRPPPISRYGSDAEDIGTVVHRRSGPSQGSLSRPVDPDPNSPHIPSTQPIVNRHTLKELDLQIILKNPQLRHDFLFDPNLQFRPTASRRKRALSDTYWSAITLELATGCTCVSFDKFGKPHALVCACSRLSLPKKPATILLNGKEVTTIRMPSRIPALLTEFLQVLLMVIQPLSAISAIYLNPSVFKEQIKEHAAQAAYIQSIFDPVLIEQELRRGLFDPSGLFKTIGATLKAHCAPMRDAAVEKMMELACKDPKDVVKALRLCMDILELMKLDIANHQLQALRPHLIRSSGQFELRMFQKIPQRTPCLWKAWLTRSVSLLPESNLTQNRKIFLGVLRGIVDLVFLPTSTTFPETLSLDRGRLTLLGTEANELCSLYLFLLLFRQLTLPSSPNSYDLTKLKNEIRDIKIGSPSSSTPFIRDQDVLLHVALRASPSSSASANPLPDERVLNLATRWVSMHMHKPSVVSTMVRTRLRDVVFRRVVAMCSRNSAAASEEAEASAGGEDMVKDEIRTIVEKISRVALVHMNAYLSIYEGAGLYLEAPAPVVFASAMMPPPPPDVPSIAQAAL